MDIQAQIKEIVTSHPVVLFMKGTPSFPSVAFQAMQLTSCGLAAPTICIPSMSLMMKAFAKASSNTPTGQPFLSSISMVNLSAARTS
jgi:hypothetical protein